MQQKKNTILTTSTANGRAAHTIPTLMKRITMMLALILSFALGARAAEYVIYQNGYFLAINNNNNGIEATQTFNPSTCVWTGPNNNSSGYLQITRNKNTYYLNRGNNGLSVSSNTNNRTTWNVSNGTIYTTTQGYWTRDYYITYSTSSWSSGWNTTENSSNVLYGYQSESISASNGEKTYIVSLESVTADPAAIDYNKLSEVTANGGSVTITTTNTPAHTKYTLTPNGAGTAIVYYSQDGSTMSTTNPVSSITETKQPTSYTWSLSSTSNANLGSTTTTATSNTVIYNKSSSTDKQVTVTVKATYTVGGTTHESEAKSTTITLNRLRENPTNIEAEDLTLAVDEQKAISYTLTPTDAHDDVRIVIADTEIATIDDSGVVTAKKAGITQATLTAYKSDETTSTDLTATCNVTVTPKAPTIEFSLGANITATISTTETGATIYYTTDGTTPTTSSPVYTAPVSVTAGATVKAIVVVTANGTPLTSPVAEALANAESGIVGNTVYLYDLEDHNWTYYQSSNLPTGYPTSYLSSPNPRNVKITYRGGGINGASPVAISALEREGQNEMVYYKTLEKSVPGMSGDYPYTVISNPFSKRPKLNSTYYGFNGWKVISGGEYILEYDNDGKIGLDETIHFTNLDNNYTTNCMSAEVVFEATWTEATVKTGNSAPSFTNGTYETNFWVLSGSNNIGNITVPSNCTVSSRYPDGTVNFTRNLTGSITAGGNNAKVEFVNMNSTGNVSAANKTFTMGRGIVNSGNGGQLQGCTSDNDCVQTVKVESGKYASLRNFTKGLSSARKCDQFMILGCDYDRAKGDNDKLNITGSMYVAGTTLNLNRTSGSLYVRCHIKSGKFLSSVSIDDNDGAGGTETFYLSVGNSNTQNAGRRYLCMEGGRIAGIAGGMDEASSQSTTNKSFDLRVRGTALIDGPVYGAAEYAGAKGTRTMIFTGGTVKGWIAGGANGTQSDGGKLDGASYVYVGGKTIVDSNPEESAASNIVINRAVGGNVFGAGCGYSTGSNSGQVTLGTNVVVADDAYVERGVYGGGSYGYCTNTQISNIYITGGRVDGAAGGVNGTSYSANIPGGVYGGACQNQGGTVNIYMTGGEVNGGLYGGSNNSGTISNNVTMQINGGQVGTSGTPANIHGGGYGKDTKVNGNVTLTLGSNTTDPGVTVYGDVYGGSALGTVNDANSDKTEVTLNCGTINGSLYGGGLGNATEEANVNGAVTVTVNGGSVKKTSVEGSGGVYGANNINGEPKSSVTVVINGTAPAPSPSNEEYALYAVYGGGNQADYNYNAGPTVTVNNCENSIEYVYGGGNAAVVKTTNVTIWGGNVIGNVFGGGHGYKDGAGADVEGNVNVAIKGGTIKKVFGGSNSKGNISGTIKLDINKDGDCYMRIGEVYGGGNEADGNAGTLTIGCTGALVEGDEGHLAHPEEIGKTLEGIGAVYGGANNANVTNDSGITLNINSGMVANTFGGNNTGGAITGGITVNINKNANTCGWYVGNVYGAGNLAQYSGSPAVNILNGEVSGNVYGGGKGDANDHSKGQVTGNPTVTIGDNANADHTAIVIGDVYGGGDAGNVEGIPVVNVVNKCNTSIGNVYGGGNAADVNGTDVNIDGGTITGMVFGGGHGDKNADPQTEANVNGNVNVDITGGTINKVFGGSNSKGNITGTIALNIEKADGHCDMRIAEVYGGGNEADGNAGSLTIGCTGALVEGDNGHVAHPENIGKTLEGIGAVYGGANNANIGNDVTLNINSGMVAKVFGGNNTGGTVNGNVTVNVNKSANTCGWYVGKVHGGGYGKETNVAENVTVNIENGTIYGDVYGGSALGKVNTNTENTTTVNLKGGIIKGDAYGGGLGDSTTEADVNGNVTVTLTGTAFTLATTKDNENNIIPTSGRIFGCNNINGSPKGTVLVKVLNTVARDDEGNVKAKPKLNSGVYELQAVYGGGNLAAYNPAEPMADKPVQVVIDGCLVTSIEYVYGGGNAAATPATDVTILGSYEIGSVFGGGNGKDKYTLDGGITWKENLGADVGIINATAYKADNSQGKYGTGNAMTSVLGGTVHNIYGGSNMKGNIVGNAVAYLDAASGCPLNAGDIYGGGNEAYMDGSSGIQLGCITSLKEIYGGARNADVGGDINLTITSGHFDRVFGGNNLGGAIKGSITVNIEETGCNPITIGELYGCGNLAAYETPGDRHPTINIRSFTSIGNVYGGGLGEDAVVEGNPTININVVKGAKNAVEYNGKTIDFGNGYKVTLPVHKNGKIGAIGNVFGGGNAAAVIGNTQVNIGTETSVVFESLTGTEAERTMTVEGADIRGNVYGGGNQADVTGKTNVKVGRK